MTTIEHWIGGKPAAGESERFAPVWNPATGEEQARVRLATESDVDAAVRAAKDAFTSWSLQSLSNRSRIMFRLRDLVERHELELAKLVAAEHGKVVDDARGEIVRGREVIEFACGITAALKGGFSTDVSSGVDSYDFRQPLGVCAGITPFNFPVMVPMWMHPIAIATGNTFVLKPSERDPSASLLIARLYADAGLPDGVFNVVNGDKTAVDALLDHEDVAAVSFVGSTPIAKYIHERALRSGKRVQALGGAKNHAVVMPDANLDWAAAQLTAAAFGSAGQRCMAVSVAVAVGDAADGLVDLLKAKAEAVVVGPGDDPEAEMGPVVTRAACDRVEAAVASGVAQGAEPVVDGRGLRVEGRPGGFFVGPTVLDHVTPDMDVYKDEVFGPVLAVVRVPTLEAALDLINANPYGNGTAVFTFDGGAVRTFERGVHVGMIGVNVPIPVPTAHYSFGGWKDSLFGSSHIHGHEGVRFYTRAKVVTSRWPRHTESQAAQLNFPTSS
ncbi:CoA-acylating methylmalonate-semialdehyde dehydrogenase [Glycomyces sp. TRM65418]|uniref:CoA-acylating methylmalonate-semialdehyde dehydrogenase n=1 Tax=Glycomyces sp. TRM65418 TaxID=2867006 RepID=UPI001CE502DD|nr:CoA-acylating methylmalonate-semialdehyde dehydrogenase [Glycomyces sp. TRM65418]MCC3765791.1 CoA-acylating methylmalonate-semialdehyde dehydrogenase [Glycomyces sp. TRM65418]QZD55381.1 CoA-acylating methylmalonate-semialdehyde dehydrogenase [Glycomyces sp. TRM65418]